MAMRVYVSLIPMRSATGQCARGTVRATRGGERVEETGPAHIERVPLDVVSIVRPMGLRALPSGGSSVRLSAASRPSHVIVDRMQVLEESYCEDAGIVATNAERTSYARGARAQDEGL